MRGNILKAVLFLTLFFVGCQKEKEQEIKTIDINLAKPNSAEETVNSNPDSLKKMKIAIGAMTSPKETFTYYKDLIKYISEKIGTRIEFTQRKTYNEVNLLLENGQVDFAFICSGAYVEPAVRNKVDILAVPVINGKSLYQAYIITHKGTGITKIEDLKGKSFAFTDPLSHTGHLYVLKRLNDLGETGNHFFSKSIFTYAHDNSIQLVEKGTVDGATIDGLIYDYLYKVKPERVKNIRIIEKSEYFGIPPIVIQRNYDHVLKEKIRKVFLDMHNDSIGKRILSKLFMEKFIIGDKKDYLTVRKYRDLIQK
ncbi:MAG: phosphate/phosphite/phosphonate ABC transporter substrate-binding protein [Ignavibacteriales bacterium]|nr:phosphate/phosphite/phosphonate ABC transporter substrate-binding protein [Ignavibacteriales bacterium]